MATISVCLIVKDEEAVLGRCLDCLLPIADEIVVVDTGSSDRTKEVAANYTDKIYDFAWISDFAAARNFAFSKTKMDYIYSADADEVLAKQEQEKFLQLKQALLPEIEIVQMVYVNPKDCNMVYNYTRELRPKLFKRLREFRWIDPIHETVALTPLVYDSDIEILHLPQSNHAGRDFAAMERVLAKDGTMSARLYSMYAKELYISGEQEDFLRAEPYFRARVSAPQTLPEEKLEALCVLAKAAALRKNTKELFALCLAELAGSRNLPAELAFLLGEALEEEQKEEAALEWYKKAAFEAENYVCLSYGGTEALRQVIRLCRKLGREETVQYEAYWKELKESGQA